MAAGISKVYNFNVAFGLLRQKWELIGGRTYVYTLCPWPVGLTVNDNVYFTVKCTTMKP